MLKLGNVQNLVTQILLLHIFKVTRKTQASCSTPVGNESSYSGCIRFVGHASLASTVAMNVKVNFSRVYFLLID